MCRILHNPLNLPFNKEELKESYTYNHDGTGVYYWNKRTKKATIKKFAPDCDFSKIWKTVSQLHNCQDIVNVAIHFRFGTSGGKGYRQTHPIFVNKNTYLMHNGVLPKFEWSPDVLSDTQCVGFWIDNILNKTKINEIQKLEPIKPELNETFLSNKLLLLQGPKWFYVNEELGEWKDNIWRSWKDYSKYGWEDSQEK